MRKRVSILVFVLAAVLLPVGPSAAQGAGCQPAPCAGVTLPAGGLDPAAGVAVDDYASPVPVVVAGLLMLALSFGVIAVNRRNAMVRSGPRDEPQPQHREVPVAGVARPVARLSDVH